jgi:hypothetical protein
LQTTGLHLDCTITGATQEAIDRELDTIRARAYAALGVTKRAPSSRTVRGHTKPMRTRPSRAQRRSSPAPASNGQVTDKQFSSTVQALGGASAKDIAARAGLSPNATLSRLHKLEKSGGVYREGERNQTRWFARELVPA